MNLAKSRNTALNCEQVLPCMTVAYETIFGRSLLSRNAVNPSCQPKRNRHRRYCKEINAHHTTLRAPTLLKKLTSSTNLPRSKQRTQTSRSFHTRVCEPTTTTTTTTSKVDEYNADK
jgi:hypothetical protein